MGLPDRLSAVRNRLIATPSFRHWAEKTPIFKSFANRSAERLFALCTGFVHSQVVHACLRLDLIDTLYERPRSVQDLASAASVPAARLEALLDAAIALRICSRQGDGRIALGELGAALRGNDGLQAMIRHHEALYADLADPLALLADGREEGQLHQFWSYTDSSAAVPGPESVAPYSALMSSSQQMVARQVLKVVDFGKSERLLDVGGGDATFAIEVARRWPHLQLTVVDLPAVASLAAKKIAAAGLGERIAAVGLDFARDPLPGGHDAISFVRILHDHNDDAVVRLLGSAAAALPAAGRVIVAEPVGDRSRSGRLLDAYFSIYLLAMGQGRPRSPETLCGLLTAAGFEHARRVKTPMPLLTSVVTAQQSVMA